MRSLVLIGLLSLVLHACTDSKIPPDRPVQLKYPPWFGDPLIPEDNQLTLQRVELGRRLFYSKMLSKDGSTSCGSCHVPSAAFTDGRPVANGAHGNPGKRNAPTLANLAWMPYFMMEGGVPTLELQALAPIHDSTEMAADIIELSHRLNEHEQLHQLSVSAYGREIDPWVITRALAAFQRTLVSGDSRYDHYLYGNSTVLNEEEKKGMDLFFSDRTQCGSCHPAPFFTDFGFWNIGLDSIYSDAGYERVTYKKEDNGKFKTPTLRNIEFTAPYMHDGSLNSLEDVLDHFNSGGNPHPSKDTRIRPLDLTPIEKQQIISFLKCLTDWNFVQNHTFLPLE